MKNTNNLKIFIVKVLLNLPYTACVFLTVFAITLDLFTVDNDETDTIDSNIHQQYRCTEITWINTNCKSLMSSSTSTMLVTHVAMSFVMASQVRCNDITCIKTVDISFIVSLMSTIETTQDAISFERAVQFKWRFLRRLQMLEISSNLLLMFATQYKYIQH